MRGTLAVVFFCGILAGAALAGEPETGSCSQERARIAELERAVARCGEAPGDWSRLRRGLSRFEVLRILGEPGRVVQYAGFERWEYPDLRGGRVSFDDRGRAMSWRRPPLRPGQ